MFNEIKDHQSKSVGPYFVFMKAGDSNDRD